MIRRLLACLLMPMLVLPGLAEDAPLPRIGLCIYNMSDPFVSSITDAIVHSAEGVAELVLLDAKNSQNVQNSQLETLLEDGIDGLIMNPVDRMASVYLIRMAQMKKVPIVLINREPIREDLALYDDAYYVGIDPSEQGGLAGQMAADLFLTDPRVDVSGDGIMQLVLFKGEPGHQDAELRTLATLEALERAGVQVELLEEVVAGWERSIGQQKMATLLTNQGDRVECVIANNDEMALGAIEALKAAGYFSGTKWLPVFGIDATRSALTALKQGTLAGTVINDGEGIAQAALNLTLLLMQHQPINETTFPYPLQDKVLYLKSEPVQRETR